MNGSGLLLCKLTPKPPFRGSQIPGVVVFSVSNGRRSPEPFGDAMRRREFIALLSGAATA